jgi:hypothetical protein
MCRSFYQSGAEAGAAEQEQPRAFRAGFGFGLEQAADMFESFQVGGGQLFLPSSPRPNAATSISAVFRASGSETVPLATRTG